MDITASVRPDFRVVAAMPLALVITALLLYLMLMLVATEPVEPVEVPSGKISDVVQVPPKLVPVRQKEPRPAPAPALPPAAPAQSFAVPAGGGVVLIPADYKKAPPATHGHIVMGPGSSVVRQVMIAPQYPRRALSRGVEGYVDVAFEVTAVGVPENVRVLGAEPQGVFEQAALAAVARWKYLPRDAATGEQVTLKERIRFAIER